MNYSLRLATLALLLAAFRLPAATLTVGPGGYSIIQQAVDAAAAHDLILVTNGTYGATTVNKLLRVRSINGPQVTLIIGGVNLDSGARLQGFPRGRRPAP